MHGDRPANALRRRTAEAPAERRGSLANPTPAVRAFNSDVRITHCQLAGGSTAFVGAAAQPAIVAQGSNLRLSGSDTTVAAGFDATLAPINAIDGTGVAIVDPLVTLTPSNGGTAVGAGIARSTRRQSTTSVAPSPIGGIAAVTLRGGSGDAFALLFGLPGPALQVPGVVGEFRLAASFAVVTGGALDGTGRFALAFPVPAIPVLRAFTFRWQGITSDGATTIWAEPGTESHR